MVEGNVGNSIKVVFRMRIYLYYLVNGKNRKTDERVSGEMVKEYPWEQRVSNKPKKYCKGQHRALFQHLPPSHPRRKEQHISSCPLFYPRDHLSLVCL